jgi:Cft2 family RNA processing exonuclease
MYIQKDSLKEQKIFNLNTIIEKKDQQISLYDNMAKDLQKELKIQQFKTKFYKAGSILGIGVAIITTTLYIIK